LREVTMDKKYWSNILLAASAQITIMILAGDWSWRFAVIAPIPVAFLVFYALELRRDGR